MPMTFVNKSGKQSDHLVLLFVRPRDQRASLCSATGFHRQEEFRIKKSIRGADFKVIIYEH